MEAGNDDRNVYFDIEYQDFVKEDNAYYNINKNQVEWGFFQEVVLLKLQYFHLYKNLGNKSPSIHHVCN